jgi:uncharacterized membrane protein (Fun14 family)
MLLFEVKIKIYWRYLKRKMVEIFSMESVLYGGAGVGVGYAVGWLLKKSLMILFKLTLFLGALFVGALIYLQSKQIILINERAFDNFVNETYMAITEKVGENVIDNPIQYVFTSLGIPVTGGLGLGMVMGWMKG